MANAITASNSFRTKLSEALRSYRENRQWRRSDYLDLRQAGVDTKRVRHAVQDLSNGILNKFEAEDMLETANETICEYEYGLDGFEEFRVAPVLLRALLFLAGFVAELVVMCVALSRFWDVAWRWPGAALWTVSALIFLAIAAAFDLGCFFGFNALCRLFIKLRITRLNKYVDALEAFVEK